MARYLFTTWDGGGNTPPELSVARRLVARGHEVRVLCDPTVEAEVLAAGCQFSAWTTAPHRTSRRREDDVFRDYELKNPLTMIERYINDFLAAPAPRWIADTCAVLDRHPVDALVADFGVVAPLIVAEARGLPSAVILPNIWIYPTPGIPPLGPGFMPAKGPLGRARDAVMRALVGRIFGKALPHFNAARAELGLPPIRSTHAQMQKADRILVLTSPKFDFTSPAMPAHVRYTGPELGDPAWAEPWRSPWTDDDTRPLVAVGLSSTFQDQVPTLRRLVEALSGLTPSGGVHPVGWGAAPRHPGVPSRPDRVRGLVTLGVALQPGEVQGNDDVVVVPSAPHGQVFAQASVVVTHCGHGTTMKALSHGVPLLCVPMGRDQNDTAARVVHAGAGLRLAPDASVAAMRAALGRLLAEPSFREGAGRLARAIETREGCVDAVETLEELVADRRPAPARDGKRAADPAPSVRGTSLVA